VTASAARSDDETTAKRRMKTPGGGTDGVPS
jgi:hypothetical protein